MKELFIKYFRDASSYQSIDPTCFNLTEYTETWLINHKKQLTLTDVGNCQFEAYATFCIECDRKGMKPLKYTDYLKIG